MPRMGEGCQHPKPFDTISGGLYRCKRCGAVRGVDGRWRIYREGEVIVVGPAADAG